jgi:hypothetical protein
MALIRAAQEMEITNNKPTETHKSPTSYVLVPIKADKNPSTAIASRTNTRTNTSARVAGAGVSMMMIEGLGMEVEEVAG